MKRFFKPFVLIFSLVVAFAAQAKDFTYTSNALTVNAVGDFVSKQDGRYVDYAVPTWQDDFYNRGIQNRIILSIDRSNLVHITQSCTLRVTVKMETEKLVGASTVIQPAFYKTVDLIYDPAQSATEVDKVVLTYDDVVKSKATINGIQVLGPALTYPDPGLPIFEIENRIHINRIEKMTMNELDFNAMTIQEVSPNANSKNQKVMMVWPPKTGAEAYEIEFTFINDPQDRAQFPISWLYHNVDFRHNATRIRVEDGNSFTFPIVLPEGFLVYRVRALGEKIQADKDLISTLWSLPDVSNIDVISNSGKFVHRVNNYQDSLNWGISIVYSEGGKAQTQLSWKDGMLRHRESLVMDLENQLPIIDASIYDHLGRQTLRTVATPFFDDLGYEYRKKINQNQNGDAYTYTDFDLNYVDPGTQTLTDEIQVNSMGQQSGANYYYSSQFYNDLLSSSYPDDVKRRHKFVPDAGGYAFQQEEVTNDPSSTIARTGSYGKIHQLTAYNNFGVLISGKESRTWDGVPFQEELDKLFATEVGHYTNYRKVMNQDANGQLSVEYKDNTGRTVASALAGDPNNTPNLDPIHSSSYVTSYNILLENTTNTSNEKVVNHVFLVSTRDTWEFGYDFQPQQMSPECDTNFCYGCAYDLTLSVLDQWGNEVLPNGPITQYIGNIEDSMACQTQMTFTLQPDPIKVVLDVGEYTLIKKLVFSEQSLIANREWYLEQSGCVKGFDEFLTDELNSMDIRCELSCDQCDFELAGLVYQRDSIMLWCEMNVVDSLQYTPYLATKEELNELAEICSEICEQTSPCDMLHRQMLSDVSLGGQYMKHFTLDDYGNVEHRIGEPGFDNNVKSILLDNWWDCDPGNEVMRNWRRPNPWDLAESFRHYNDEDGSESLILVNDGYPEIISGASYITIDGKQYAKPHELKHVTDFIKYWKNSWANSLVYMHPEYCYYEKCLTVESSYAYDAMLYETSNASVAQAKGFYNPLNMSTLGTLEFQVGGPQTIDYSGLETGTIERDPILSHPYFASDGSTFETLLEDHLYKLPNGSGGCNDTINSIWEIYEYYRMDQGIASNVFSQDTCIEDVFWPILRGLYLSAKQKWLKSYYEGACPDGSACSDATPQSLIGIPRWEGAADINILSDIDPNWSGLDNICDPSDWEEKVTQRVESECNKNCDYNVDMWLEWLSGCDKITSLTTTQLDDLKVDLKNLCMSGCDMDHIYGSISKSPENRYNSAFPFNNLHDVFAKHLGWNWFEEGVCDDLLIQFPGYYGHDYLATDDPKANDCVCDSVKWHTSTSCPDLIFDKIYDTCGCSYPHDLMVAKASIRGIGVAEKCQNCIVCKDLIDPVYEFFERYDSAAYKLDTITYQDMLAVWLNRHFGFNLTYEEYALYAASCVDLEEDSTWFMVWENIGQNRLVAFNDAPLFEPTRSNYDFYQNGDVAIGYQEDNKPVIVVNDLTPFIHAGFAQKMVGSNDITSSINWVATPGNDVLNTSKVQDAAQVACHCEKIMKIGHLMDNNQANGLTPEQLFDQLYQPTSTWPTGWNFNDMKNLCCKMWNMEPSNIPGPCTPSGDYEPGKQYDPGKEQHIDNELLDPNRDPNLDLFSDEPCNPDTVVTTEKSFLDTCGCNKIKELSEDYLTDPNGAASGLSLEAYALQEFGFAIDNIDFLLQKCQEMWSTGERKDANGNSNTNWGSTSGWSKIGQDNLEEFAEDMDWLLNESLLCNPKNPCQDEFPCGLLTKLFMRYWTTIPVSQTMITSGYSLPPEFVMYEKVNHQIGLGFDLMDDLDLQLIGDPEWEYKRLFLEEMLDSLNLVFSLCKPSRKYSLNFYLSRLRSCHREPCRDCPPPCMRPLTCQEIGAVFKEFLKGNPRPDDPGYAQTDLKKLANDIGNLYEEHFPDDGTMSQAMRDWFALLETFFNEEHNRCYKSTDPETVRPLDQFLQWSFLCRPGIFPEYKAAPCPKCYVGDTTYLHAFKDFLDQVTHKDEPNYLHQSLWPIMGNGNYDIDKFHNNPLLYSNGFQNDLEYITNEVKVPELDITIQDLNGYTLEFNLLFPDAQSKWNFGEIMEFTDIYPVRSGGCNAPNLFEIIAVYRMPSKYWGDKPSCPNVNINGTDYCYDTIPLMGRFKNHHIGIEVSCLSCSRLCNKPFYRPVDKEERCHDGEIKLAIENALIRYDNYLQRKIVEFDSTFKNTCMNADSLNEQMQVKFIDRTYHYTLMHYDRAGNLIKTVPPAGIDFENTSLSEPDRQLLIQDRITKTRDYRKDNTNPRPIVYHTLNTQFKYNSLDEIVYQYTPDGGEAKTWYDVIGRPVLVQSSKQAVTGKYSYKMYDNIGRLSETGDILPVTPPVGGVTPSYAATPSSLDAFLDVTGSSGSKTEVVSMYFDGSVNDSRINTAFSDLNGQQNLRSSIAAITYEDVNDDDSLTYDYAGYFTYGTMTNVNRFVQDIPALDGLEKNLYSIDYVKDLLSQLTCRTDYQKGKEDEFSHRFEYDKNNRLSQVYTSEDNYNWERDARYDYYFHGSLARTELGELNVQGMDFMYTLNGHLKGLNSPTLDVTKDIGLDGNNSSAHTNQYVARDAISYDLHYFDGDYLPIQGGPYGPNVNGSDLGNHTSDLYNGNIARMVTSIATESDYLTGVIKGDIVGNAYRYDQLNRLTKHRVFDNYLSGANTWQYTGVNDGTNEYYEDFSYDANGNILTTNRHGDQMANLEMDAFSYHYDMASKSANVVLPGTGGSTTTLNWDALNSNKLYHLNDDPSYSARYASDIDDPGTSFSTTNINLDNTYGYNELGDLIRDESEEIATVTWTSSEKIKEIVRYPGSPKPDLEFGYDAYGNRLYKIVKPKDASMGNTVTTEDKWTKEYYITTMAGARVASYIVNYSEDMGVYKEHLKLKDNTISGAGRLGVVNQDKELVERAFAAAGFGPDNKFINKDYSGNPLIQIATVQYEITTVVRGKKQYELTNHLGNVLATIQDRKWAIDDNSNGMIDYYIPYIETTGDYYAFGADLDNRGFSTSSYSYGFGGFELDEETSNYTTFYRQYDARIGRWTSTDPVFFVHKSTYASFNNNPIYYVDPLGSSESSGITPMAHARDGTYLIYDNVGHETIIQVQSYWTNKPRLFKNEPDNGLRTELVNRQNAYNTKYKTVYTDEEGMEGKLNYYEMFVTVTITEVYYESYYEVDETNPEVKHERQRVLSLDVKQKTFQTGWHSEVEGLGKIKNGSLAPADHAPIKWTIARSGYMLELTSTKTDMWTRSAPVGSWKDHVLGTAIVKDIIGYKTSKMNVSAVTHVSMQFLKRNLEIFGDEIIDDVTPSQTEQWINWSISGASLILGECKHPYAQAASKIIDIGSFLMSAPNLGNPEVNAQILERTSTDMYNAVNKAQRGSTYFPNYYRITPPKESGGF